LPPYRPLSIPTPKAKALVQQKAEYRLSQGYMQAFEQNITDLHHDASANRFEQALKQLAITKGLRPERHDEGGEGPDVLWL
ncbi:hypothetical protein R0K05_24260, partial [Planococcus sp. SIMBA_160]